MRWGPTAFTPRYFRSRNFYIWSMWGLRSRSRSYVADLSVSPTCLCCDLRDVTDSEQFGVLAPVSSYPSVAQGLVVDVTVAPFCFIVPSSFLVSLALGCLGLCLDAHFYFAAQQGSQIPFCSSTSLPTSALLCVTKHNYIHSRQRVSTQSLFFSHSQELPLWLAYFAWIPISLFLTLR